MRLLKMNSWPFDVSQNRLGMWRDKSVLCSQQRKQMSIGHEAKLLHHDATRIRQLLWARNNVMCSRLMIHSTAEIEWFSHELKPDVTINSCQRWRW